MGLDMTYQAVPDPFVLVDRSLKNPKGRGRTGADGGLTQRAGTRRLNV
jgi:hypothetical protein